MDDLNLCDLNSKPFFPVLLSLKLESKSPTALKP